MSETPADQTKAFDQQRKMLFSTAYRMLGSILGAEGMVSSLSEQRDHGFGHDVCSFTRLRP